MFIGCNSKRRRAFFRAVHPRYGYFKTRFRGPLSCLFKAPLCELEGARVVLNYTQHMLCSKVLLMKKFLLCLLLSPLSASLAQQPRPVIMQPGAVITLPTGAAPSALAFGDFN